MTLYTSLIAPTTNTDEWTMHGAWINIKDPDRVAGSLRLRPNNGRIYSYSKDTQIGGYHSINLDTDSYSKITPDVLAFGLNEFNTDSTPVLRLETGLGEPEFYHKNTEYMSFYGERWRFTDSKGKDYKAWINGRNARFQSNYGPGVVGGFYADSPDAGGEGPAAANMNANQLLIGKGTFETRTSLVQLHSSGYINIKNGVNMQMIPSTDKATVRADGMSFSFHTNGNATAPGSWVDGSDANTKSSIATLDQGISDDFFLSRMKQLRPVTFKRNGLAETETGFLAQEVGSVLPSAMVAYPYTVVTSTAEGVDVETETTRYGLRYSVVTANLVAAMKQLITKVETLEAQVAALS